MLSSLSSELVIVFGSGNGMLNLIDRSWRILATAIAFTTFGIGGLLLRLLAFPLLQLCVRDRSRQIACSRLTIQRSFQLFIKLMRLIGILRYDIEGIDRLRRQGQLVLANHPTLLDVVFLVSLVPNANCVVKASLARNPFMRGPIRAAGYICNNSGAGLIDDCIASVKAGDNLIIFPEGTRTPANGKLQLQRGAANIAVRGELDMTLVTINCSPRSLTKGLPWWQVPPRRMHFTICAKKDLTVAPFLQDANGEASIAARRLTTHLHQYFTMEHERHAGA